MRLRVKFGFIDNKDISWYRPLDDFPKIIKFLGRNYEWIMYDKDLTGKVDMILMFSEIPSYDLNFNVFCPLWTDMFGPDMHHGCECGANKTSFPWDHMRFCSKWTKW